MPCTGRFLAIANTFRSGDKPIKAGNGVLARLGRYIIQRNSTMSEILYSRAQRSRIFVAWKGELVPKKLIPILSEFFHIANWRGGRRRRPWGLYRDERHGGSREDEGDSTSDAEI